VIRPLAPPPPAADAADRPQALLRDVAWLDRLREVEASEPLGRLGRFEVFAEIGRGGQGVVYRALDPDSGDVVAVKRLHPARGDRREALHQVETEARAVRALSHPDVVRTRGVEADGAHLLLVMDWVDGVPLTEWAASGTARRSRDEIVTLVARVAEILAHAHERGVVHRDLKPTNVLVDGAGRPHLLDFGMARLDLETSMSSVASTRFVGTLAYAPPELVERGPAAVDARSDLYSLGVSLYEMLEGRLPCEFGESIGSAVQAILSAEPRPLSGAPRDARLEAILHRLLAKQPDDRYGSAAELLEDLRAYLRGDRPKAHGGAVKRSSRRRHLRVWVGVAGAASILALAVTLTGAARDRERRADDARATGVAVRVLRAAGFHAEADAPWSVTDADRVLAQASQAVDRELNADAAAQIEARLFLAHNLARLGLWPEAAREARLAKERLAASGTKTGPEHAAATALIELASADPAGRPGAWMRLAAALERFPAGALIHAEWLTDLEIYARGQMTRGNGEAATLAVTRAADLVRRLPEPHPNTRFRALDLRASAFATLEDWPEAERAYREAIADRRGRIDPLLPVAWSNLGSILLRKGDAAEALRHYREAAALRCEFLAAQSPADPDFPAMAAELRRDGFDAPRLRALGRLFQERAPRFVPALIITARRAAEAEDRLGHAARAAALREAIQTLESGPVAAADARG